MESYVFNLEHMLRSEMDATDDAKYQLLEKDEKIEQLENTIEKLKEKNKSLEVTNDKLAGKVEDQEAQIGCFRGQCIYLHQILMKYKPWPTQKEASLIRPYCITILYHNLLLFIDIFHI
jgi:hypothetical protein